MSLALDHADEVLHLHDHAARRQIVGQFLHAADLVQPETDQGRALRVVPALRAADLLDLDALAARHDRYLPRLPSRYPPPQAGEEKGERPQSAAASLSTPVRRACSAETLMLRRCATERGES